MSVFAIGDLHLSFLAEKPMNIFKGWDDYVNKIKTNWNKIVNPNDTVIIVGDISWGMHLNETVKDFEFVNGLAGNKIILKGNHDFWWDTVKKNEDFLTRNGFNSIKILFNNSYIIEDKAICGTRGWFFDDNAIDTQKVILREVGRLERSILSAKQTRLKPVVFMHYPVVWANQVCLPLLNVLLKHGISDVYYGHLHSVSKNSVVEVYEGINFHLVSCDFVDFTPYKVI